MARKSVTKKRGEKTVETRCPRCSKMNEHNVAVKETDTTVNLVCNHCAKKYNASL